MGKIIRETADIDPIGCAKLVVFCNAVEDNPFMAGAFHGVGEPECVINVGVSGPGVVAGALRSCRGERIDVVSETIKRTAFKITRMGQLVAQEASRRLDVPFGVVDLSLAPTPAVGDSVAEILELIGLERCGTHGTTAALALLNDAVKKGGVMASSHVGGLSGAFIPVSEDAGMIRAAEEGVLQMDKLECRDALGHHRGRGRHRHDQRQDHRRPPDPGGREDGRRPGGLRRSAGLGPGHPAAPRIRRRVYCPRRPHPRPAPQSKKLK